MNISDKMQEARQGVDSFMFRGNILRLQVTDGSGSQLRNLQSQIAQDLAGAEIAAMLIYVATLPKDKYHEDELIEYFACYVSDQMVVGSFPNASFQEDDEVGLVVSRIDGRSLYAHAVVRHSDNLLWMPNSVCKGRLATAIWLAKLCAWISLIGWSLAMVFCYSDPPKEGLMDFAVKVAAGLLAFSLVGIFCVTRSSPEGPYAERIMHVLGFKRPKIVNLSPFSEISLGLKPYEEGGSIQVYDLNAALKAYDSPAGPPIVSLSKKEG